MPLDTESLGSLRIERSSATSGGGNRTGLYIGIAVVLLLVAAGTWFFMRPQAHRSLHRRRRSGLQWPESGHIGAQRVGLRGRATHGHGLFEGHGQGPRDLRRGRHGSEEGPGARAPRSGQQLDHAHDGGARARSRETQSHGDRSAPGRRAPQSRAQRSAGQAAAREPDGARYLARRSERAGRAPRGLAGAGEGVGKQPRHAAHRLQRSERARAVRRAWSFPRTRSRAR